MSFHPINTTTGGAKTWNESGPGLYIVSTIPFGGPQEYLKIARGRSNVKTGQTSAAVSYVLQKDVTTAGVVNRLQMQLTNQFLVPTGTAFTVAEADTGLGIINEFVALASLDRILKGEQ